MPKNPNGNERSQSPAIHLTLQGKGGVGKSLVAAVLAQYLRQDGRDVRCIDTDPVNRTFAQYAALAADRLNLRDEHNRIEQRAFDALMERFLTEEAATFVVDNGASTFLPLWHYILENDALEYLREHGRRVYVHTVITGGQALLDTLNGFNELAQTSEHRNIVVWVNEYFGRVEADGKKFSEMAAYRDNAEKVCGAVIFQKRNQDTFGRDLEEMIAAKMTFQEAICAAKLPIMAKQRLKLMERDLFDQLARIPFQAREMEPLDLKKLAAEVSAQHGIRVDPDDPIMAVMTLNRLVFERALDEVLERLKASTDDIERAAGRVQVRAGTALAQEVREYTASIEQKTTAAIDSIVATAGRHQRKAPRLATARVLGILILSALAVFAIGMYMGALLSSTVRCRG